MQLVHSLGANDFLNDSKWFALYTKPKTEKKLKSILDQFSIKNYLPLLNVKKRWSDRWKTIETPLFSSYIFVKIKYLEESLKVLKIPQSVSFVTFQGKPAEIKEDEIELLQIFLNEYPEKLKIAEMDLLQPGKEVEIKNGPFAGRIAIVEKRKNQAYIILNIPTLNKMIKAEIKISDLGIQLDNSTSN